MCSWTFSLVHAHLRTLAWEEDDGLQGLLHLKEASCKEASLIH